MLNWKSFPKYFSWQICPVLLPIFLLCLPYTSSLHPFSLFIFPFSFFFLLFYIFFRKAFQKVLSLFLFGLNILSSDSLPIILRSISLTFLSYRFGSNHFRPFNQYLFVKTQQFYVFFIPSFDYWINFCLDSFFYRMQGYIFFHKRQISIILRTENWAEVYI